METVKDLHRQEYIETNDTMVACIQDRSGQPGHTILRSAIIVDGIDHGRRAARYTIKATCCDWLVATTKVVVAHTLATNVFERSYIGNKVWPIQFSNRIFVVLVWTTKV